MTASMLSGSAGIRALTESVGAVPVPRDVLVAEGPDALKFLQSQVSQDLSGLAEGAATWSFLLQPTGKLVGFFRVTRVGSETYRLDSDPGIGTRVEAALRRFLIRTKCTLSLTENSPTWAVRGPDALSADGSVPAFPGMTGYDLLAPDAPDAIVIVAPECLDYVRIASGVPVWPNELTGSTIPNATGLVAIAVSFTKGCYVGQELVERIDSRGASTPRVLRRIVFPSAVPTVPLSGGAAGELVVGAELCNAHGVRGAITSVAVHPDTSAAVALGYVHRDVDVGSPLAVASVAGVVAALEIG